MNDEPTELGPGQPRFPQAQGNGFSHQADPVRAAEGRARGAEYRAAELEGELASIRERSARMDEQFERLRGQLEALSETSMASAESAPGGTDAGAGELEEAMFGAHTPVWSEVVPAAPEEESSWVGPDQSYAAGWEPEPSVQVPPTVEPDPQPAIPEASPPEPVERQQEWAETAPPTGDPAPTEASRTGEFTPSLAGEQIASILAAAQEAAQRIVDQARARVDDQVAELSRQRRQAELAAKELTAWREQARSMLDSLASEIEQVRVGLAEVPGRLAQAFAPLGERIPAIQKDMADLARSLRSTGLIPSPQSPEDQQRLAG
jgi:hypothetical protein